MSRVVEAILENWHDLSFSEELAIRDIIMDLQTALQNTVLTQEETLVIEGLYFADPVAPIRDRVDKRGTTNGKPLGGTTQYGLASYLFGVDRSQNAANIVFTKTKQSALRKIGESLGKDYTEYGIIGSGD